MSKLAAKPSPGVESVEIVVQVPAPAGDRWNATLTTAVSGSVAVALRPTVPRRCAPGSASVVVGPLPSSTIRYEPLPETTPAALVAVTVRPVLGAVVVPSNV